MLGGFGIPYLHNWQMHEYIPGCPIQFTDPGVTLGNGGEDPLAEVRRSAEEPWVAR
jgi:hypothetical protein